MEKPTDDEEKVNHSTIAIPAKNTAKTKLQAVAKISFWNQKYPQKPAEKYLENNITSWNDSK